MKPVLVAMSGGVDSSAAALLLQREGYSPIGCTMQLWDARRNRSSQGAPPTGRCCSLDDAYDARRVAEQLGFPFYVLNLEAEFEEAVVHPFVSDYLQGLTPIPCTLCNRHLKFDRLFRFAASVGIEMVATGHYARIRQDPQGGLRLLKGADAGKDQSYFLFELGQEQLSRLHFPLGDLRKSEVRAIAEQAGLRTFAKPDSQEICFVPDGDYADFISRHAESRPDEMLPLLRERERGGAIVFRDGTKIGMHHGIHHFTLGQRKGLGVAHPSPLYVIDLEVEKNEVVVGRREETESRRLCAGSLSWVSGAAPGREFRAEVRIRSAHREAPAVCRVEHGSDDEELLRVEFDQPQNAITPGQAAVLYRGEEVLGGGWIRREEAEN